MIAEKKPDNIVFNTVTQQYDAALKSYATSVGAPSISAIDNVAWKNRSINKINHKVATKFSELKAEYEKMMLEFEYNKLIFDTKFNFEPIVGGTYHLYKRDNGETFLSIIAPNQWNYQSLGSFRLNADQIWEKII